MSDFYKDSNGSWHLTNGDTLLMDVDPSTGAYQETDGTWYTYQGVAVSVYDKNTGSYQENDGTWYDRNGNVLTSEPSSSKKSGWIDTLLNIGKSLLNKNTPTKQYVPPVNTPTTTKSNIGTIVGLALGAAAIAGIYIYYNKKEK